MFCLAAIQKLRWFSNVWQTNAKHANACSFRFWLIGSSARFDQLVTYNTLFVVVSLLSQMAAQWRMLNAGHFHLPGDCPTITQREVVDGDGCAGRQLLFHVNGKVVECRGDPKSQDWQTMLQFAGRDVTLLHAQKFPNPDYPVPCGYAQIRDHHRAKLRHISSAGSVTCLMLVTLLVFFQHSQLLSLLGDCAAWSDCAEY